VQQLRPKGHLSRPRLRNPHWLLRQQRTNNAELVTAENRDFINKLAAQHDSADQKGLKSHQGDRRDLVNSTSAPSGASVGAVAQTWTPKMRRCGVIARKIGQYPLWLKNGQVIRTTLLQIVDNHIIKYMPPEKYSPTQAPNVHNLSKYGCLLVGAESTNPAWLTKEYSRIFLDSGVAPKKTLARFIVSPEAALTPGTPLNVSHFRVGDFVDVRGKTVDHGFQGVVKRHGFKGMPASHGVTKTHRRAGNIGGGGEKGRVWPGTKMPGHMGSRWRILKGLRIWRTNSKYNVMWVQGNAVPGATGGLVYIYDTILPLRKCELSPPFPTYYGNVDEASDDIWYDQVHNFKDKTIIYDKE
ncbi:hypothetical protein KR018_011867, partial [Drosophila ironensis]